MRTASLAMLALTALTGGCAVLPHHAEPCVTEDALHQMYGDGCDAGCACGRGEEWPVDPHFDKFDRCAKRTFNKAFRPDLGYEPPPAVPLAPGPPGRFFPVPTQPAFAPRGPAVGGHL